MDGGDPRRTSREVERAERERKNREQLNYARGIPLGIDMSIMDMLDMIDEQADVMCDRIKELIAHSSAVCNSTVVQVRGYSTDAEFWVDWPDMAGWPCALWNIAATVAIDEAREVFGIDAKLVDAG